MKRRKPDDPYYPTIFIGWDNTPQRKENGIIIVNSLADAFTDGLSEIVKSAQNEEHEDRLVSINAWNEWAEGKFLKPAIKHGLAFLE